MLTERVLSRWRWCVVVVSTFCLLAIFTGPYHVLTKPFVYLVHVVTHF